MLKQNKRACLIKFLAITFFVVFSGCFSALQAQAGDPNEEGDTYIDINQDTVWRSTEDLNFTKIVYVNLGATLTIEKGARIKFGKDINGGDTYLLVNGGRLIANGTQEEPISITADADQQYYLLEFRRNYWEDVLESLPSFLRYVEIYGGGYAWDTECPGCSSFLHNLILPVYAEIKGSPALFFTGGKIHMENCTFHDNEYADVEIQYNESDSSTGVDNYLEIVNSNFEKNGNSIAVKSKLWCKEAGYDCASKILLKNNWYDSSLGPKVAPDYIIGGEMIEGDYTLEDFRSKSLIADPVIIIPGILGSNSEYVGGIGQLKLDPIMHTFDNLVASFKENGYTDNQNLFEFPYEWRNSNVLTVGELRNKIQAIKDQTKISKVDLVAHSMGGLLARYYIENLDNQSNIDQLITLGTPHKGAPQGYMYWEAGEGFFSIKDKLGKEIFLVEAHHADYDDLGKYIRERVLSVGELLPDYDYLTENGTLRDYPNGYPRNEFLEVLNETENTDKLKNVNFINIIGNILGKESTVSGYRVVDSEKWEHGMPENFDDTATDRGIELSNGDETVPLASAEGITSDKKIEINSAHNDLPTEAQCEVIKELTGKTDCEYVNTFDRVISILTFSVFSPIDIQVEAPNGKKVGKNFANGEIINEIDGAYYSGAGAENEFLTIPDPADGDYKILTQGTGNGEYKIEVAKITEDPATGMASESVVEIIGTAVLGQEGEKEVKVEGTEVTAGNQDTLAPEISITSPEENKTYLNNQILPVNYQITDNQSLAEKIQSQAALDGVNFTGNNIDLSLQNLGEHKFKITATDEAGNSGEKEISFRSETSVKAIIDNVNHYSASNLIKNKADKTVLISRLKLIQEIEKLIKTIENCRFFNSKVKKNLIKALEKQINEQLNWLAKYVKERSKAGVKNGIDPKTGGLLIESLNFLKYS